MTAWSAIWKFEIAAGIPTEMPVGAVVLSVKEQFGRVCLWAKVDTCATEKEVRHFEIITTGITRSMDGLVFIDTVLLDEGQYVVHVFERLMPK